MAFTGLITTGNLGTYYGPPFLQVVGANNLNPTTSLLHIYIEPIQEPG